MKYNLVVQIGLRYILISDDVRTEISGKLIVIGLYGPEILVPRLPSAIPLALIAGIVLGGEGPFELSGKLVHPDSKEELLTFGATGEAKKGGSAYVPFKFPSVRFRKPGQYEV